MDYEELIVHHTMAAEQESMDKRVPQELIDAAKRARDGENAHTHLKRHQGRNEANSKLIERLRAGRGEGSGQRRKRANIILTRRIGSVVTKLWRERLLAQAEMTGREPGRRVASGRKEMVSLLQREETTQAVFIERAVQKLLGRERHERGREPEELLAEAMRETPRVGNVGVSDRFERSSGGGGGARLACLLALEESGRLRAKALESCSSCPISPE